MPHCGDGRSPSDSGKTRRLGMVRQLTARYLPWRLGAGYGENGPTAEQRGTGPVCAFAHQASCRQNRRELVTCNASSEATRPSEELDVLISMTPANRTAIASCACGSVQFEAVGRPIVSVGCYCNSCQAAGRQIEQLPTAPKLLDMDGGTTCILYRKDRGTCTKGSEKLQDRKLKPDSPTRRVVAGCCNSAMFLDFTKGHWLSMYRVRFPSDAPPIEMRVMTRYKPESVTLADDVPNCKGHSGKFMWRLLAARLDMMLGR